MRSTRRELGLSTMAAAALAKAEMPVPDDSLDPVRWTLQNYPSAPLRLTFRATNRAEAELWQQQLRAKITDLLGGFPARTPLKS